MMEPGDAMIHTVIIDDEPLARRRLRDLLGDQEGATLVAECEDGLEGIKVIAERKPDLVFLDVQMPGMNGFEILEHLEAPLPLIIFTTAYEKYAIRAFEVSAVDYLLKPIDERRFREAFDRARAAMSNTRFAWSERIATLLSRLERREKSLRRIVVRTEGRVFFLETRDVDWFEAAGNYIRVHVGGETHLVRMTMHALQERLDRRVFARIHRSIIVNVSRIAELQSRFRGNYVVLLKSGAELELSKAYREHLEAAIGAF